MNKANDHSKYPLWIDPASVKPYERNAKIHTDKQIKNIANSIKRFGWQQDTVLTSDNVLVIGHGRRLAALELGCEMPYHMIDKTADELTDKDIRELRIADNQTNAETGLDFSILEAELDDLDFKGFDFNLLDGGVEPEEKDAGDLEDNTSAPVSVKIVFPDVRVFRKIEAELREVIDKAENARVSVGCENENHEGDV